MSASTVPTNAAPSPTIGGRSAHGTLVVGLDGTATSWSAFWWAWGEARRLDGRVLAVYVSRSPESRLGPGAMVPGFDVALYTESIERINAGVARQLETELRQRTSDPEVSVDFVHVQGDAVEQLARIARQANADVIAVGRSARRLHHLAGSLGRRLTRRREAPIVVIVP